MIRIVFLFFALAFFLSETKAQSITSYRTEGNQVIFSASEGELRLFPLSDNALRVKYMHQHLGLRMPEWIYMDSISDLSFKVEEEKNIVSVVLPGMRAQVNKLTGLITFISAKGETILQETGRELTPSSVQDVDTYHAIQKFYSPKDEHLFGLGQFQDGHLDVRGLSRRLTQVNTQIAIPMLISDKGYGVLWNNYGLTDYNPASDTIRLIPMKSEGEVEEVEITSTEGGKKEQRESCIFTSQMTVPVSGHYSIMLDVGQTMARKYHLRIGDKIIFDMNNRWLPPTTSTIVKLEAGTYDVVAHLEKNDQPEVLFKLVNDETVLSSPVAECVDYTVFCGDADKVVNTYRQLTGNVPMMPNWALGYIHSRERFHSQNELLEVANRLRADSLPVDVIVQDWQYWGRYGWNAMKFDEAYYPTPKQMVDELHDLNLKLMVSVWSKIDPNSEVGKQMHERGFFIPGTSWVDFFNSEAAAFYWKNFSHRLLSQGIDAWWQDATEPENDDLLGRKVAGGKIPGEIFRNTYPLLVNKTVYEGLRGDAPNKRVMILTRSSFPGMQRYATATWSGDVGYDWNTLRRQIVSGLSMSVSGQPWWTYDAGGFFRPSDQYTNSAYQECMVRWIQTSIFLPLMRVHGYVSNTEFWNYKPEIATLAKEALKTRYSLAPYIYSENANISFNNGTFMRPLVMDFAGDSVAVIQKYQYMFGPSLLVSSIVESNVKEWNVYFPKVSGGWYDFWSDEYVTEGGWKKLPVSMKNIPVHVKAGSILPLAVDNPQTMVEALNSDWVVKVYEGADGTYTLYEDEGTNYNYEKGWFSNIRFTWNNEKGELTIGAREGKFPAMKEKRHIRLVKVSKGMIKEQKIYYQGEKLVVKL